MGKPKRSREEILEQQKLRQQRSREKIKNNPALYAAFKEKDRERYHKKKSEGKMLSIDQETPTRKKQIRKRNRENFKAYYNRRKQSKALEIIQEISLNETESEVNVNLAPNVIADPLTLSPVISKPKYNLRSIRNEIESKKDAFGAGSSKGTSDDLFSMYPSPSSSYLPHHHLLHNNSSETSIAGSDSESLISVPKQKINSPTKLAIRRLKYRSNKQIQT